MSVCMYICIHLTVTAGTTKSRKAYVTADPHIACRKREEVSRPALVDARELS